MVKKMAKGTAFLMIGEAIFIVTGYLVHFGLTRLMEPEVYGIFGVILSLLAIVQIFLQNGIPQAVSRFTAAGRNIISVKNEGIKAQILFTLVIFTVYFLSAPQIAALLGDRDLTPYIRLSALILPIRAIYMVLQGLLDGTREFKKHAVLRGAYSLTKMFSVLALVYLGFGIGGVIFGYIFASALVLALGWPVVHRLKWKEEGTKATWKELAMFSLPVIIFSIMFTAVLNLDILFVKSLIEAGEQTGFYSSSWMLGRLPFFIFLALSFTLIPSIARSQAEKDIDQTRSYISTSMRYYAMSIAPLALFVMATSSNLLSFLFTPEYQVAGNSLRILIFGVAFLAGFYILSFVCIGGGKPKIPMYIVLGLVPLTASLCLIFIPYIGIEGAAISTTITGMIGLTVISIIVFKEYKALIPLKSFIKIMMGSGIIYLISILLALEGFLLLFSGVVLFLVYLGFLYMIKEIKKEDIDIVKNVLARSKR
jgi:stage V sporulation protein B